MLKKESSAKRVPINKAKIVNKSKLFIVGLLELLVILIIIKFRMFRLISHLIVLSRLTVPQNIVEYIEAQNFYSKKYLNSSASMQFESRVFVVLEFGKDEKSELATLSM